MLTWEYLNILSYGAGTPSTTLALMSCQNARHGPPYPYPEVPIYDAVIFCDLHSEPSWVYKQAEFTAAVCAQVGIPFYRLDSNLYRDFTRNFGRARTACIPFWTMGEDGKKGRMPRQCTLPYDVHAHNLHMGIMWEERHRATESKQTLFTKQYPLVKMGWTRQKCFDYNKYVWGLSTMASCCLFCPFHSNYFYQHIREHEPDCYARALHVDKLVEIYQARPPLKSELYLSKSMKRIRELTSEDCEDMRRFLCRDGLIWDGF